MIVWVRPGEGDDNNDGTSFDDAVRTLARAQDLVDLKQPIICQVIPEVDQEGVNNDGILHY